MKGTLYNVQPEYRGVHSPAVGICCGSLPIACSNWRPEPSWRCDLKGGDNAYIPNSDSATGHGLTLMIDMNCDMGENSTPDGIEIELEIISMITSANIACGFHAGNPGTMRRTVRLALDHGVAIGAHPSLHDRAGFGREEIDVPPQEIYEGVLYQIGALHAIVQAEGGMMGHVKPHGALYNMAARRPDIADAIARAIYRFDPRLSLYGLAGSELIRAAERAGLHGVNEAFADRAYLPDGSLMPRASQGGVLTDVVEVSHRAYRLATEGTVTASDGTEIHLNAETICIHSDTPGAPMMARAIRELVGGL